MYIHCLQFNQLSPNIFKIILTNDTIDAVRLIHSRFYTIQNEYTFIINDNVELAKEIEADGVHLGRADRNPAEAREISGDDFIIGGTANTFDDIVSLLEQGVDYIGLGPFRFTETKKNLSPVLGLEGIKNIVETYRRTSLRQIPVIAIGGIKLNDVEDLIKAGVHGIAVSSAINISEDKLAITQLFLEQLRIHQPARTPACRNALRSAGTKLYAGGLPIAGFSLSSLASS